MRVLTCPLHLVNGLVQQQEGGRKIALVYEQRSPCVQAPPQRCVGQKPRRVSCENAIIKRAASPVQSLPWQYALLHGTPAACLDVSILHSSVYGGSQASGQRQLLCGASTPQGVNAVVQTAASPVQGLPRQHALLHGKLPC